MFKRPPTVLPIVAIIVTVLLCVINISYDQWKSSTALQFQLLSTSTLVGDSQRLEKLQMFYDGKPIRNASQMKFALINSGRKPIVDKDVSSPVTIQFSETAELLDLKLEGASPKNLEFKTNLDNKAKTVTLTFSLLNPTDYIVFSVIVAGEIPKFEPRARIAGIKEISVIDKTKDLEKPPKQVPWFGYFTGVLGLLTLLFLFFVVFRAMDKEEEVRAAFKYKKLQVPQFAMPNEYLLFMQRYLPFRRGPGMDVVVELIKGLPPDKLVEEKEQRALEDAISHLFEEKSNLRYWVVICVLWVIICAGFFSWRVFGQ